MAPPFTGLPQDLFRALSVDTAAIGDYQSQTMRGLRFQGFSLAVSLLFASGCNLTAISIKGTADATKEFADAHGKEFADPELLGPVLAAGIVSAEGALYFVPNYETIVQGAAFNNIAYGKGWLEAAADQAELAGNFDEAEKLNKRASLLYGRALTLAKRLLRQRDTGFDSAMAGGLETFKVWVNENFYEEKDAQPLLVAGISFLVSMMGSPEGLAAAVDMPYARYMVERSVEIDPKVDGAQGLAVLGTIECTIPEMVGGNPKLGLSILNRAAELTKRRSHGVLIAAAERCAVALQDRKLFHDLLTEVLEASDVPEYRLPNKLARHAAERLLKKQGDLFYD